jgi:hypothetical protein
MENIYSNSKYAVRIVRKDAATGVYEAYFQQGGPAYDVWYEVVNKETGVAEYKDPSLPQSMFIADTAEFNLTHRPWAQDFDDRLAYMKAMRGESVSDGAPDLVTTNLPN